MKTLFVIPLILFITSCKAPWSSKTPTAPLAKFKQYSKDLEPNGKNNLIFAHVYHCPNCDMVKKLLIPTKEFEQLTKGLNLIHTELGSKAGMALRERYKIDGGPIFALTDPQGKLIDKSPYGFLDVAAFRAWLLSLQSKALPREQDIIESLIALAKPLVFKEKPTLFEFLTQWEDPEKKVKPSQISKWLPVVERQIKSWGQSDFPKDAQLGNYYRLALTHMKIADLKAKVKKGSEASSLKKAVSYFKKMGSGNIDRNYGNMALRIILLVRMDQEQEAELLAQQILASQPKNRVLLFGSLAYAHLNYSKNCQKVLEFSSKIPLEEIPVPTEKINMTYFRVACHGRQNNKKQADEDFAHLKNNLTAEEFKLFPQHMARIEKILKKLNSKKNSQN